MNFKRYFEQLIDRNKILKYIYIGLLLVIGIIFVIGLFSWDSLLSWVITNEKSDLKTFIFWVIFSIVVLIVSIVATMILSRKKK